MKLVGRYLELYGRDGAATTIYVSADREVTISSLPDGSCSIAIRYPGENKTMLYPNVTMIRIKPVDDGKGNSTGAH